MIWQHYSDESLRPAWKKIIPIWWLLNDREPVPPAWYRAQQPRWTLLKWYLRNPFQNLGSYCFGYSTAVAAFVLDLAVHYWGLSHWWLLLALAVQGGVADRAFWVGGPAPLMATTRTDADPADRGWKWNVIMLGGWLPLPFISYEDPKLIFYAGWQPTGFFGFKLHPKSANAQWW